MIERYTGFSRGSWPLIYLGSPIVAGWCRISYFESLVDKVKRRVEGWGARFLNVAGRLTLVKNVLASIPIHILAVSKIPMHVINKLDQLMRDFLWGSKMGKRLLHWVSWDLCTKSLDEIGLGIRKFQDLHLLFCVKGCWNLLQRNSLWSSFVPINIVLIAMVGLLLFHLIVLFGGSL